jgi:hypothetical protein
MINPGFIGLSDLIWDKAVKKAQEEYDEFRRIVLNNKMGRCLRIGQEGKSDFFLREALRGDWPAIKYIDSIQLRAKEIAEEISQKIMTGLIEDIIRELK